VVRLYNFFEDEDHFYIVMELMKGGDLFDLVTAVARVAVCVC